MHVKLNVIKIFNRLSLLANQTSLLSSSVKVNHAQYSLNAFADDVKSDDTDCERADVANNNSASRRLIIMSSSLQLHEDDLSRIDVKSLVSEAALR